MMYEAEVDLQWAEIVLFAEILAMSRLVLVLAEQKKLQSPSRTAEMGFLLDSFLFDDQPTFRHRASK